MTIMINITVQL